MTEKKCTKCGEVKPLDEFNKKKKHKDGLAYQCKLCSRQALREWKAANPEKVREDRKKWKNANPEKHREQSRVSTKRWNRRKVLDAAKKSEKHTYFVTDGEFVKVGVFTAGKLESRLMALQNGNPRKLKVLATSASNVEKLCHYEFEDLNVLNEWFKFDLKILHFFTEHAE